ncbi:MAG: nucleotidyltransferase domain-containing protein [Candidatus Diapherotrites archaeon]|nr:nucleotidyltransferase domain-containing protein [Candidatus Diapherotrites archaeon]
MAHKITPSRRKFGIAKRAAQELLNIYGNDLKAVYVAGSVASNMAVPGSDIDMALILEKNGPNVEKCHELRIFLFEKLGQIFHISAWSPESFKNGIKRGDVKGIIPLFERENYLSSIARAHGLFPKREEIIDRYGNAKKDISKRMPFKRSTTGRKRFLPR